MESDLWTSLFGKCSLQLGGKYSCLTRRIEILDFLLRISHMRIWDQAGIHVLRKAFKSMMPNGERIFLENISEHSEQFYATHFSPPLCKLQIDCFQIYSIIFATFF